MKKQENSILSLVFASLIVTGCMTSVMSYDVYAFAKKKTSGSTGGSTDDSGGSSGGSQDTGGSTGSSPGISALSPQTLLATLGIDPATPIPPDGSGIVAGPVTLNFDPSQKVFANFSLAGVTSEMMLGNTFLEEPWTVGKIGYRQYNWPDMMRVGAYGTMTGKEIIEINQELAFNPDGSDDSSGFKQIFGVAPQSLGPYQVTCDQILIYAWDAVQPDDDYGAAVEKFYSIYLSYDSQMDTGVNGLPGGCKVVQTNVTPGQTDGMTLY